MTPHIEAKKEEIAPIVIMPGDPLRAKLIAENFLDNYKLVNQIRGIFAYTGTYKGKEVTVMASGMGMPSMGIYSYELYDSYDVDIIIRVGSVGAYCADLNLYDLVLVKDAYSESAFAKTQNGTLDDVMIANPFLNNIIIKTAEELSRNLKESTVHCSEIFYKENDNFRELYEKHGCIGCEMESFALFHTANIFNKKAACILTCSNNLVTLEETSSLERQNSFMDMIELALESTLKM
jgi:purine-nucleoside phosphorylase, family 1 (deoD)